MPSYDPKIIGEWEHVSRDDLPPLDDEDDEKRRWELLLELYELEDLHHTLSKNPYPVMFEGKTALELVEERIAEIEFELYEISFGTYYYYGLDEPL